MIEQAIYERLSGDAAIAARVAARIYPVKLPQDTEFPALTFFRASTRTTHTYRGQAGLAGPRFQVSVWTKGQGGYLEAIEIAELVRLALDGFKGVVAGVDIQSILLRSQNDTYEDDIGVYHRPMDFDVWHQESVA